MKLTYNESLGIDTETSTNKFPWFAGHFVSIVSTCEPNGSKETFIFTHDENNNLVSGFTTEQARLQAKINQYKTLVGHNLKFDLIQLDSLGINFDNHNKFCTMQAKYLLQYHMNQSLSLNDCARIEKLPLKDDRVQQFWKSGYETNEIPLNILQPYCEHDAYLTLELMKRYLPRLRQKKLMKSMVLAMEFMDVLWRMEKNGALFDRNKANQIINRYKRLLSILKNSVITISKSYIPDSAAKDFNPRSGNELSVLLYGGKFKRKEKIPKLYTKNVKVKMPYIFKYKNGSEKIKTTIKNHPKTTCIKYVYGDKTYDSKGLSIAPIPNTSTSSSTDECPYYKTDKGTLEQLKLHTRDQKIIVKTLLKISKIQKMLETFEGKTKKTGLIHKIGLDGALHTTYNQAWTATGRLSSRNPNNQNLPRSGTSPIKQCIKPRFDFILDADLSQIELRVPAFCSQDPTMMHEINSGVDLHNKQLIDIFKIQPGNKEDRVHSKIFNFRMIYRGSAWGFFKDDNMPSYKLKRYQQIIDNYWKKYQTFDQWHQSIIQEVIDGDGTLRVPTGRIYKFKTFNGKYNEHQIVNYPIQGIAGADILPLAAVLIWKAMQKARLKSLMILTVHDSIVFDAHKSELKQLAKIILHIFKNMDKYMSSYFNLNWNVKITGEIEKGTSYGNTKKWK